MIAALVSSLVSGEICDAEQTIMFGRGGERGGRVEDGMLQETPVVLAVEVRPGGSTEAVVWKEL